MLVLHLQQIVKNFDDRVIFSIEDLKVYSYERIGIVGLNGAGKTTLLDIMTGVTCPDEGNIIRRCEYSYITQYHKEGDFLQESVDKVLAKQFRLDCKYKEYLSGGEKTRYKLVKAFSQNCKLLFADEPTSNLDVQGTQLLQEKLEKFTGALIIVSHDRELLDKICNKILEIEDGTVKLYRGNYSSYIARKEAERQRKIDDYKQYIETKKKLEQGIADRQYRSAVTRKAPKRMGNSEARLHKMGDQRAKKNLNKAVKGMEDRLEKLEKKEKPKDVDKTKFDLIPSEVIHSKVVIESEKLQKSFGAKRLFHNAQFKIYNRRRTALIGENGCGKTTLLKMILDGERGIKRVPNLKFGYFNQAMDILEDHKTVLDNVMGSSSYPEHFVRILLARLLIKGDDVFKKVACLSGGERVKVSLVKVILSDTNILLLDEPTNYLDVYSMEALETVLSAYEGNLLFVSHDRKFINKVATDILLIQDGKMIMFNGNYEQYLIHLKQNDEEGRTDRMVLENRLSEIIGRLSIPSPQDDLAALDREYRTIVAKLQEKMKGGERK